MSNKIIILPETLTHRIAAGEVIERPASIVKELVENSLDAGATELAVELEKGGTQSIRVTDNGEGMGPDDILLAFSRHATSKITQFDDLYSVRSFGFRGEALPSIASIARVEITSRPAERPFGARLVIEEGELKEQSEAGCPVGTSILVTSIFEPIPVRKKFLKGDMTEQGYCLDWITRLALARPDIRIQMSANGKTKLNIPAARDLSERIALTMGADFREQLVETSQEKNGASVYGFVSRPEFTRSNATQMYIYVNGRFVKDSFLSHAVMTAYRRLIEPRRYPLAVIFVDVPAGEVDVNVHPTKMEVRFRNPREIYGLIVETLGEAIGVGFAEKGGSAAYNRTDNRTAVVAPGSYNDRVEEALKRYRISSGTQKLYFGGQPGLSSETPSFFPERQTHPAVDDERAPAMSERPAALSELSKMPAGLMGINDSTPEQPRENVPDEGDAAVGEHYFTNLLYLGQVEGTYLVFAGEEGLVIIDQHAAHERVLFEKMRRQAEAAKERGAGQRLLLPEVISLPPRELSLLVEAIPILADVGMEIEPFGGDSVVVKSVPAFFADSDVRTMIADLLSECGGVDKNIPLLERRDRIFSSLSCRGAIKANQRMSAAEAESLCRELDRFPGIATCPHGRPLKIAFSKYALEKLFKRR
ncbi:MAG: DNA mismatch repair endonuclease MutL [Syntrophobacterales bacterium]|nr:DNA mismatch repair endonuclease MutL [Syntrophobacterales bacterium]